MFQQESQVATEAEKSFKRSSRLVLKPEKRTSRSRLIRDTTGLLKSPTVGEIWSTVFAERKSSGF